MKTAGLLPRREVNRINVPLTRLLGSSALQACFQDAMSLGKTESIRITKDTFRRSLRSQD